MNAVQMMTGHGGWPMSVFLTPELQPFFGGTYWPPRRRYQHARVSARSCRRSIDAWQHAAPQALEQAAQLTAHLRQVAVPQTEAARSLRPELLHAAVARLRTRLRHRARRLRLTSPSSRTPSALQFLLRMWPPDGPRGGARTWSS